MLLRRRHITANVTDETVFFKDRKAWRHWLVKNHDKSSEIWILTYKRHTGVECLSYEDALEEAICHGWIDSRLRRIDDDCHTWRFTPRRTGSIWSRSNRDRAERLIREGRMTKHGMVKVEAGKESGEWDRAYVPSRQLTMPKDLRDALDEDATASANFRKFAKSYRQRYIRWVDSAKGEETRKKRIRRVVTNARRNVKSFMG